jgi:hypothetical protein
VIDILLLAVFVTTTEAVTMFCARAGIANMAREKKMAASRFIN